MYNAYPIVVYTTQDGVSPLYTASQFGHSGIVDLLLRSGADPNAVTKVWDKISLTYVLCPIERSTIVVAV